MLTAAVGGAQYGVGPTPDDDLLTVDARAFERDANPEDYSLEAIIAHERGHQLLLRHPRLARFLRMGLGVASEEILASVIGSLLVREASDQRDLMVKAIGEAVERGMEGVKATRLIPQLRTYLESYL